ncbi:hypothetical protein L6452_03876 [Arctium lappa]|uniref:Uncharacterized protein n=1 Tax=Arctium lappa TaxID=4217 RepID=A0ACB9FNI7_ARCLA|nr:hypothetical protein L6452_03876 [Arctium lappa]
MTYVNLQLNPERHTGYTGPLARKIWDDVYSEKCPTYAFGELLMDLSERYCYNPTLDWNPQVEEHFNKAYGAEVFARISKALTQPSCYSCIRVNTLRTTVDVVIENILEIQSDKRQHDTP